MLRVRGCPRAVNSPLERGRECEVKAGTERASSYEMVTGKSYFHDKPNSSEVSGKHHIISSIKLDFPRGLFLSKCRF